MTAHYEALQRDQLELRNKARVCPSGARHSGKTDGADPGPGAPLGGLKGTGRFTRSVFKSAKVSAALRVDSLARFIAVDI